ncbi:HNH endonuclease [Aliterella atlantica]|uniref:HNH endonuclease n=1 Tax=Aliterella atlantica CENA595 TaxID=1618023 RepID=A0A0D8ZQX9_9CYAN|nr:HNH endonuclease signature motif containing protein [Aliterella atlantica]KJH71188.1 HNH endonuclease [Aliterella atlantica CENA595]
MTVNKVVRQLVRDRAKFLCEYCHSPEWSSADLFTLEHILPQSLGGSDELDNLALACRRCNERRYNFLTGIDSESRLETPLFQPRQQVWAEHFIWTADGIKIISLTSVGRATINRLDLNDEFHNDGFIQRARDFWIRGGWHPPHEDLRCMQQS